jgi:heme O synthase-like polyprenyltransferase
MNGIYINKNGVKLLYRGNKFCRFLWFIKQNEYTILTYSMTNVKKKKKREKKQITIYKKLQSAVAITTIVEHKIKTK